MKFQENLCMGCMNNIKYNEQCPVCGYDNKSRLTSSCIRPGNILEGKYIVGKVLRKNDEGFEYIGFDINQESPIYIKELMPRSLCDRIHPNININVQSKNKELFAKYLNEFLHLARALAMHRELKSIAPVYDIFEANNTAYYISTYIKGTSLREFIKKNGGHINWEIARPLFVPLLSTLIILHKSNIFHFGITPETLIVTDDNKLLLTAFSIYDVRHNNNNIKCELSDGYSAPEQYSKESLLSQSTDVYGYCASLFFGLSGLSATRANSNIISKSFMRETPDCVIKGITNGLKPLKQDRISNFEDLRMELCSLPKDIRATDNTPNTTNSCHSSSNIISTTIISVIILILCACGIVLFTHREQLMSYFKALLCIL